MGGGGIIKHKFHFLSLGMPHNLRMEKDQDVTCHLLISFLNLLSWHFLTLELSIEPLASMVAVRCEVETEPVLAADHRRWEVHACEPGEEKEEGSLL